LTNDKWVAADHQNVDDMHAAGRWLKQARRMRPPGPTRYRTPAVIAAQTA
jgi:hypothetical protein